MLNTASELYALSQGGKCTGKEECYWCTAPCERKWVHDDAPPVPFTKKKTTAKRPGNLYICTGCWMYRMERITIRFLDNTFKDRQKPQSHSWWITKEDARSIGKYDYDTLYSYLLNPPLIFSLSLISDINIPNLLQLQLLNNLDKIQAETELQFTLNNIPHTYTVYELEEGLKHGSEGKMPGVQALIRHLGPHQLILDVKKGKGRPKVEDREDPDKILKRVVANKNDSARSRT
jgi:hypothetical protein